MFKAEDCLELAVHATIANEFWRLFMLYIYPWKYVNFAIFSFSVCVFKLQENGHHCVMFIFGKHIKIGKQIKYVNLTDIMFSSLTSTCRPKLYFNKVKLDCVTCHKYLEFSLSENANWNEHIKEFSS